MGLNDEKYKGNKGFEEDKKGPDLFWPKVFKNVKLYTKAWFIRSIKVRI